MCKTCHADVGTYAYIYIWRVWANFSKKAGKKPQYNDFKFSKYIINIRFSQTYIPYNYPIPTQLICRYCSQRRTKIKTSNQSGELGQIMWGVEFMIMITAYGLSNDHSFDNDHPFTINDHSFNNPQHRTGKMGSQKFSKH